MKTTIEVPDEFYRRAKAEAALRGQSSGTGRGGTAARPRSSAQDASSS
jgi:hypothetical protein